MAYTEITSFDQIPSGVTANFALLFQKIDAIEALLNRPQSAPADDELLTREQAAEKLKVSLPTLNELTKSGKIPGYRIGNRLRYKASEIINASLTLIITNKAA